MTDSELDAKAEKYNYAIADNKQIYKDAYRQAESDLQAENIASLRWAAMNQERDQLKTEIALLLHKQKQHEATVLATCEVRDSYCAVLEAVRSQMVWERDRDQLTMGFKELHKAVTEVLEARKS